MNAVQKLRSIHDDLTKATDGFKIVDAWTLAARLLSRMPTEQTEATRACNDRDLEALDRIITALESPTPAPTPAPHDFTPEQLEAAMGAFKRRLRIVRLNDESRLGGRYTSAGRRSGIDAIEPPKELDHQIWKALADAGRLRKAGGGMYALGLNERPAEDP